MNVLSWSVSTVFVSSFFCAAAAFFFVLSFDPAVLYFAAAFSVRVCLILVRRCCFPSLSAMIVSVVSLSCTRRARLWWVVSRAAVT